MRNIRHILPVIAFFIILNITTIFYGDTVRAETDETVERYSPVVINTELSLKLKNKNSDGEAEDNTSGIRESENNIFYINKCIEVGFSDTVTKEEKEAIDKAMELLKEKYPSETVDYFSDEKIYKSEYTGDAFSDFKEISGNQCTFEADEEGYVKYIARFQKVKSVRFYTVRSANAPADDNDGANSNNKVDDNADANSNNNENDNADAREVIYVADFIYKTPVYQFVIDTKLPSVISEGGYEEGTGKINYIETGRTEIFTISDKTGIKSIELQINDRSADIVEMTPEKRIIKYDYEINLPIEKDGTNSIKFIVYDIAGNKREYELNYSLKEPDNSNNTNTDDSGKKDNENDEEPDKEKQNKEESDRDEVEDNINKADKDNINTGDKDNSSDNKDNSSDNQGDSSKKEEKEDETVPTVFFDQVANGEIYYSSASPRITVSDEGEGTVYLYVKSVYTDPHGNDICLENDTKEFDSNGTIAREYSQEGIYSITAYAYDSAGNCSDTVSVCFGLDTGAPEVYFANIINGMTYGSSVNVQAVVKKLFYENMYVNISGEITDEFGKRPLELPSYDVKSRTNKNIYTFSEDGNYSLMLNVEDMSGNSSQSFCNFSIDKKAPELNVTIGGMDFNLDNKNPGSKIMSTCPDIAVTTKDESSEYEVYTQLFKKKNGDSYEMVDETRVVSVGKRADFTVKVRGEGEYLFKAAVKDTAQNMTTRSCAFIVDENPPVIGYVSDFSDRYLKQFVLPDSFGNYITDLTKVTYKAYLNTEEVDSCDIKKDGKYLLQIVATDEAYNKSEEMIAFIVDNTLPKVIVQGVDSVGQVSDDGKIRLTLFDEDDFFKTVSINGQSIPIDTNRKEIEIEASEYGNCDITVVAADYAGNVTTQVIKAKALANKSTETLRLETLSIDSKDGILDGEKKLETTTLTKNNEEIRETFFDKISGVKFFIICGFIFATAVIFIVIAFVDIKKLK